MRELRSPIIVLASHIFCAALLNAQCTTNLSGQSSAPTVGKTKADFETATVAYVTGSRDAPGRQVQIGYKNLDPFAGICFAKAFNHSSLWTILVDNHSTTIQVQKATVQPRGGIVVLQLSESLATAVQRRSRIDLFFALDTETGVQPESIQAIQPRTAGSAWLRPTLSLTTDKRNPNLDVTGSLQSAVGATPQYSWTVLANFPAEYYGRRYIFGIGPTFTGIANQQANADPDALKASAAGKLEFPYVPLGKLSLPINLLFNPIAYEFERKAKSESVLVNGKAISNPYQQKNSNLIVAGGVQIVEGFLPVNVNLNLGTEFGSATSRSVLNLKAHPGYSDAPLRALAGTDVYFNVPFHTAKPLFTVVGHYTVRALFHPEPFQQEGVNDGNQFYSTKARHSIAIDLARAIVPGIDLTVQYRFGSLPPTFSFVDHQVNIGFEFLLGK